MPINNKVRSKKITYKWSRNIWHVYFITVAGIGTRNPHVTLSLHLLSSTLHSFWRNFHHYLDAAGRGGWVIDSCTWRVTFLSLAYIITHIYRICTQYRVSFFCLESRRRKVLVGTKVHAKTTAFRRNAPGRRNCPA